MDSSTRSSEAENLTPETIQLEANEVINNLLPPKSKVKYMKAYENFLAWKNSKGARSFSENVFLAYFQELSKCKQPSTLWSIYSMLKSTVNLNHDVQITSYTKLVTFLKRLSVGHTSKKSKVLSADNIDKFLNEAPDQSFLAQKVALIFGVTGACRGQELIKITVDDIEKHSDTLILVKLNDTKTNMDRSFVIRDEYVNIVERYQSLRPAHMTNNRFFIQYRNGKCTRQVMGKNKLSGMPQQIASFLNLPNPEQYTGHCFRRTSATILADAGADLTTIKRLGGWKSSTVAEGYIENSVENKSKVSRRIADSIKKNRSSSPQPGTSAQARAEEAIAQAAMAGSARAKVLPKITSPTPNSAEQNETVSQTFTEYTNTQINKTSISVPDKNITLNLQNCTNVTINF